MKLGILKAYDKDHENLVNACEHLNQDYEIIDILDPDWVSKIKSSTSAGFLCHPPNDIQEAKSMIDERLFIITKVLGKMVYPGFDSLYIYENKRNMSAWLQANDIPHPETHVFAKRKDAVDFFNNADFPLVFKTNVGAGASGVDIVRSKAKAKWIARKVFGSFHPAMAIGRLRFGGRLKIPLPLFGRVQKHYLIVQKFHKIKWEWRMVKFGNYYAGHKKLLEGNFASGSGKKGWDAPPFELLEIVRHICQLGKFDAMSIDIFETEDGAYLVNELQTIFGSLHPYQMKKDGVPGVYKYYDGNYEFIPGEFHQYRSNILRINNFIDILKAKKD
jgi:glutathione synthase/RimK-type ligase-like ATP-grasp enzyme